MIDTGMFVAGVGVMVAMDLATFGAIVHLAGQVGEDDVARSRSRKALSEAREAKQERGD